MTSATLIPPSVSPGATAAALLSAFPAAMAVVGLDLRFHYANPAMTRLLGARVHPGGALADGIGEALARGGGEFLRVAQPVDRPRRVEHHRRGDHRACKRAAASLVDPAQAQRSPVQLHDQPR